MRIGLTGAAGTGKTSVAREFVKKHRAYEHLGSVARSAAACGFLINDEATALSQLLTTLGRVDQLKAAGDNFVAERTILDHLAYTRQRMEVDDSFVGVDNSAAREYYYQKSLNLVLDNIDSYDLIFYFPVYWTPKKDEHRLDDAKFQLRTDFHIKTLLDTFSIPYVTMGEESVRHRVRFIEKQIGIHREGHKWYSEENRLRL